MGIPPKYSDILATLEKFSFSRLLYFSQQSFDSINLFCQVLCITLELKVLAAETDMTLVSNVNN